MSLDGGNLILLTDSYKVTHHLQYPPKTQFIHSYFESRGGKYKKSVFFGLQYIVKKWLEGPVITKEMIDEAEQVFSMHFLQQGSRVFNRKGWEYIVEKHGGRLPLRIRAVPEGALVPVSNALFIVENTDPEVPWLTNYFESLLVQVWYPITVATGSFYQKQKIKEYLLKTSGNLETLPFKLVDFGFRGSSSVESAGIGGASHLVNFRSSDNLSSWRVINGFYKEKDVTFHTIPATEHSTTTTWGREGEVQCVRNFLENVESGSLSVVSDSYDLFNMVSNVIGGELKDQIESRSGCLVVRPDSGDPVEIVLKTIQLLADKFGCSENAKGFKVLPKCIAIIQGDGICYEMIDKILSNLAEKGWSAENITFGSGGALLQKLNRDTLKCAYKCSFAQIDDKGVEVFKDPVTDPGKKSKRGQLMLVKSKSGEYNTIQRQDGAASGAEDCMVTVFENGNMTTEWTFSQIKDRLDQELHDNLL